MKAEKTFEKLKEHNSQVVHPDAISLKTNVPVSSPDPSLDWAGIKQGHGGCWSLSQQSLGERSGQVTSPPQGTHTQTHHSLTFRGLNVQDFGVFPMVAHCSYHHSTQQINYLFVTSLVSN